MPSQTEIFTAAVGLPLDERAAFLDEACGADAALRGEVESLLRAHDAPDSFLREPAARTAAYEPAAEAPGTVIGAYKLLEQIGEGGFGVVYMAEQTAPVRRKVALKVLKPGMDTKQVVARFEAERQALAVMDHPNIAKVLDGGATPSGRPYFVMELVRGAPITDYSDANHLTPRQRLELFVQVCAAVQHAHQKGIIHRDLKPSNILVTVHDTVPVVKVIDFGIAKALGQELTDKTLFTGFAQMVGTPLYMSPEQAGQSGLDIDTRSDIYSLGVLLYELLTGTTPFTAERFRKAAYDEIRRIIREEEPPRPSTRLSDSKDSLPSVAAQRHTEPAKLTRLVRGELDWIVMKALEKHRNRRYESANGFAADVQRYLADEPVQACPPSTGYRFRKFARRNRRTLATSAVLVAALLVAVGGVAWSIGWANRDRAAREAAAEQEALLALHEAERWQGQRKWPEALSAAKRAQGLAAGGGSETLRERIRELRRDVEMVLRLEDARHQSLDSAKDGKAWNNDAQDAAYLSAFRDYGIDVEALPAEQAAERIRARPVHLELAGALDHWAAGLGTSTPRRNKLIAIARAVDSDEWRNRVRDALWAGQRGHAVLAELAASEKVHALPPVTVQSLAVAVRGAGLLNDAVALLRDAQQRHPDDFWINFELAWSLDQPRPPSRDEAVRFYSVALALRPGSIATLHNLANTLRVNGRPDEAIPYLRKAIEIDPRYAKAHIGLGNVLRDQKKLDEAIACFKKAIDLDPRDARAHNGLGNALRNQKKLDEAIAEYRTAIELDAKYALAHNGLGNALADQNKLDEAIAEYHKAIELDPKDAGPHSNLGLAFTRQGKLDEAVAECRKAIELDPLDANSHNSLGNAVMAQKKLDEAIVAYRTAIELDPRFAMAHYNLGNALADQNKLDEAIAEYHKAIELDPQYSPAHNHLGIALGDQGKVGEAVACYRKAIELDPKNRAAHFNLGLALDKQKKLDAAIHCYRTAIALDPKNADAHYSLGLALRAQKKLDEAAASFREAIKLDPKHSWPHNNLGAVLRDQGKVDEAMANFRKALEFDPRNTVAHYNLGCALADKRQLDEALASLRTAVELDPGYAAAHRSLGSVLQAKGEVDLALTHYRKAAEGLEPPANKATPYVDLAGGYQSQGKWDEAVAGYKKAIEVDPKNVSFHWGLGSALQSQGKWDEAIACYLWVVELAPRDARAHDTLAWTLATCADPNLRDPAAALRHAETAVELAPKWARGWQTLAWARYRAGDWKGAVAATTKVKELGSKGDSREWFLLALAHSKLGDKAEARAWYDKAVAWMEEYQPTDEALRRFQAEAAERLGAAVGVTPAPREKK